MSLKNETKLCKLFRGKPFIFSKYYSLSSAIETNNGSFRCDKPIPRQPALPSFIMFTLDPPDLTIRAVIYMYILWQHYFIWMTICIITKLSLNVIFYPNDRYQCLIWNVRYIFPTISTLFEGSYSCSLYRIYNLFAILLHPSHEKNGKQIIYPVERTWIWTLE